MPLVDASRQAILKADEKDGYYINVLKSHLNDICQRILGAQFWIIWKKEIELLSQLLYYFFTTVQGSQTLGEEYACYIQVNSNKSKVPSLVERIALVALQCISPYMAEKLLLTTQANLLTVEGISSREIKYWTAVIKFTQKFIPVASNMHLMAFYLDGTYASISKRIVGIKHILVRQRSADEYDYPTFYFLASLSGIQILVATYNLVNELKNKISEETMKPDAGLCNSLVPRKQLSICKCILCLESIQELSATTCGHLFCWNCIIDWCDIKSECPTCREHCVPSKVIRLHHFSC